MDSESGRARLLAAAHEELREHGQAALGLRAVARRAGVSHAAPAYHFRDRAGLLTAVAIGFTQLAAALDGVSGAALPDRLAELGRRYAEFAIAHPALYELMFRPEQLDTGDPALLAAREASLQELTTLMTSATQEKPERDPQELVVVAWAFAHGIASLRIQGALPPTPIAPLFAEFADRLVGHGASRVPTADD
jgi:AcrR family transcriptional regulator